MQQAGGQGQTLSPTGRQRTAKAADEFAQLQFLGEFVDSLAKVAPGNSINRPIEPEILESGQVPIKGEFLRHVTNRMFYSLSLAEDIVSPNCSGARCRYQQAAKHSDGGGLAGAVGPQKTEYLACLDSQADFIYCSEVTEFLGEAIYNDRISHHFSMS